MKYAVQAGYDNKKAFTYAFLDGLNQGFLDLALSSLPSLGTLGKSAKAAISRNVSSAVLRFLALSGVDTAGEFTTEMMQTAIENGLRNAVLGEQQDASRFSEEANRVRVLVEKKKELENTKAYLERKKSEAVAKEIFRDIYEPYGQAVDFAEESRYDVSVKNAVYRAVNLKRVGGSGASDTEKLAAKMEDNEAQIYNYLYKTQGKDKASAFLEDMRPLLNQRLNEQHTNFAQTFADKAPGLLDIVTFGSQLVDGVVMTPFKAVGGLTGDYEKNWAAYDSLTNFTNTIRTDHAQDLSKWVGSEWAGFVYNTVMSLGDVGVALLASKGVGNVLGAAGTTAASAQTVKQTSDIAKTVTQIIMASEAANQTMTDARARGMSGVQITILGLASACIESLTEKYSLDALFKNPGNAVRYVLNNAVTEGSEEAVANVLNTLMDELVAGDRSIIKSRIGELMADGVSYRDAAQQVFLSKLKELGLDTLAGLFVGATLSGLNVSFKQVADIKTGVQAEMKTDSGKKPHVSMEEFANKEAALEIKGTKKESITDKAVVESKASADTQNAGVDETNSNLDKTVYNGNKGSVAHGEQKAETRDAFNRRTVKEGLEVKQRGKVAFAFRRTNPANTTHLARQVRKELTKLGVPCIVVDRFEKNGGGVTTKWNAEATTARGDAVYINNNVSVDSKEAAGHEAFHFWSLDESAIRYKDALLNSIDFSSTNFKEFVGKIQDDYFGDEIEVGGDNWGTLAEEIFAHISGRIHAGDLDNTVHQFLYDYDAVKSAWDDLVNSHTNKNDVQ